MLGRLLIIPVALSGACLSLLFGVPVAQAMETENTVVSSEMLGEHGVTVADDQREESQPGSCAPVRMEHDTQATAPGHAETSVGFLVADLPHGADAWQIVFSEPARTPLDSLSPHPPFSLIGIMIKRE